MPVIAGALLWQVLQNGPISYHLGGWPPPWGIEYRVDVLSAFVLLLVSAVSAVMMPFARRSVAFEIEGDKQAWFYSMYLLCLTGLLGITITGDAFNAFVFLEISSLSTYVLIAMGRDRRALLASYQYLIMGTIGATFYVIGVGLLYLVTGSLNMVDIASRLGPASVEQFRPIVVALAFLTVGISLKLALFPLHVWLPNAYAYAPSFATAFLAATATKVAVYLLVRIFFSIFGVAISLEALRGDVLLALSVAAMFLASILAVYEQNLKRMLAYSSVAQIGYITFGISLANTNGLTGGIVHLFNHAVMKGALFLALGAVVYRVRHREARRPRRDRPQDAVDVRRVRDRRARHHRHAWDGRLHLEVVPGARRARQGTLAAGVPDRCQLADRAHLHWPRGRGRIFPSNVRGRRESVGPTAQHAAADPGAGGGDGLLRRLHRAFGRRRRQGRTSSHRRAEVTLSYPPEVLVLAAVLIPFIGALLIPLFHRVPNLREAVTLATAGALFLTVLGLLGPVLAGARPEALNIEVVPGLALAFKVEPLGMLFALVASGLWIVTSIYSIGYMRGNDEPRQTSYYVCFAVALGCTIGIAFAKNLFTLFLFYEALTLSTYPLVVHKANAEAIRAGRIYLLLLLGTSLVLLLPAIVITWALAGTIDFTPGGILEGKAERRRDRSAPRPLRLRHRQGRPHAAALLVAGGHGGANTGQRASPCGGGREGRRVHHRQGCGLRVRAGCLAWLGA